MDLLYLFFLGVLVVIAFLVIAFIYFLSPYSINVLIKTIVIIAVGLFFLAFSLLLKNTYLVTQVNHKLDSSNLKLPIKEVILFSENNILLSVWEMKYHSDSPTIILSHGFGADKSDLLDIAKSLYNEGYNCVLFDFRGHGRSAGKITSFGYKEQQDLKTVINYVLENPSFNNKKLGLYGLSMGAAVSILVSDEYKEIKTIVADSSYPILQSTLENHVKLMYHIPIWLMRYPVRFAYWVRFLRDPVKVSCIDSVKTFKEKAIFYINGAEDIKNPSEYTELLYKKTIGPKKKWIIYNAGHNHGINREGNVYKTKVLDFFNKYLPTKSLWKK